MELALLRSLMDKGFYEDNKGYKCPDELFTSDLRKIKRTIRDAVENYDRSISVSELEAIFKADNPSMTTAVKARYEEVFSNLRKETPMGQDIAREVLGKKFQQFVGEKIANLGFSYVNGEGDSLQPLQEILDTYGEDFIPEINVEWDDIDMDTLLDLNDLEARWVFNLPTLTAKVEGINAGHLVIGGARPNTGKTSFHASVIAGPNGFAQQGARCAVLCNEESTHRVGARYMTAATGMTLKEIKADRSKAMKAWDRVRGNIMIKDSTGKDLTWVESVCKSYNPDILVLDMGDKFNYGNSNGDTHEKLKQIVIQSRIIAKKYGCAIIYMSQLSAEAEGKIVLNQSMMEGSKTGKASEADLMILLSKNPPIDGQEEADNQRHINIVKNKLIGGWHGYVTCYLDTDTGRYVV